MSVETKVPKSSLLGTAREVDEIVVSTKLNYRLHRAYTLVVCIASHSSPSIRYFVKLHSVVIFSQNNLKTTFPFSTARGFFLWNDEKLYFLLRSTKKEESGKTQTHHIKLKNIKADNKKSAERRNEIT